MSLEYAIEYPCEMRRRHGEQRLRMLARTSALVSQVVAESLADDRAPSEETFQFTTRHAAELEEAEGIGAYCRAQCPARLGAEQTEGEPIGCLGRIRYPIDAALEGLLADRVQLLYDTRDPESWPRILHLLVAVEPLFDGEASKALRAVTTAEGMRFFALRLPLPLARHARRVTTDNLFDALAGFSAADERRTGYQRELPLVALSDYAAFLHAVFFDDVSASERARWQAQSRSFAYFERFARAVLQADELEARVLMD